MNNSDHVPADDDISSTGSSSRQSDPQGPVPALSPPEGGRSPARPSTSAVAGGSATATYSPDDNKLRLYVLHRLDAETYARVKAAGFKWAPKQDLFVAPMWTPAREDLLIELAGEIDDEDTALVDRAEQRAERFEGYSERRAADAESARQTVEQVSQRFEFGQPILVGHHSERRARKDAERIENGMRKAVKMWQTSTYWTQRAAGAIAAAKYKERPDVRARRIKTIEADKRKQEREIVECERKGRAWVNLTDADSVTRKDGEPTTFRERVLYVARHGIGCRYGLDQDIEAGKISPEDAQASAVAGLATRKAHCERWVSHLDNRLTYERAMLAESGYTPPPKPKTKASLPLLNYAGPVSYRNPWRHEEITTAEPVGITKAELAAIGADYKGTRVSACGTHRVRTAMLRRPGDAGACLYIVYLTDSKQHPRPAAEAVAAAARLQDASAQAALEVKTNEALARSRAREAMAPTIAAAKERAAPFAALRETLKAGVKVVVAPQLFLTPAPLAARMVQLADISSSHRVLEPSAGTGSILRAILAGVPVALVVVAVEINPELARAIPTPDLADVVITGDFLADPDMLIDSNLGTFDRILMNPPFAGGQDIAHIKHALTKLRPGGRLVALCAAGPRQERELRPIVVKAGGVWERLPADTFVSQGTSVRTVLISLDQST